MTGNATDYISNARITGSNSSLVEAMLEVNRPGVCTIGEPEMCNATEQATGPTSTPNISGNSGQSYIGS